MLTSLTGTSETFGFNIDNEINNSGFTFDGSGNPTTYESATFSFDPEDRLTGISSPSFSAAYDGDGLRAYKTEGGTTTYFLYDGDKPIVEETYSGSSATISAVNVWGADGWRARYYPSLVDFFGFTFDPQGNDVEKQTSGNTVNPGYTITSYEAYGKLDANLRYSTGAGTTSEEAPEGFGSQWGYYTDASGLICLTHRYYDPGTGRFINRDPIGYNGGVNLYELAGGNPVNAIDPSGEWFSVEGTNPGDPQYQLVFKTLHYLKRYRPMARIIDALNSSKMEYRIRLVSNDPNIADFQEGAESTYQVVNWDPYTGIAFHGANGNVATESPALGLGHELVHAYHWQLDPQYAQHLLNTTTPKYDNLEEKRTIAFERGMAKYFHQGLRFNHNSGWPNKVSGPFDTAP